MDVIETRCNGIIICRTEYDRELNQVTCIWNGYADLAAVKRWGEAYLKLMRVHHCPYLLNDDRETSGPWFQTIDYIENYLAPNLIEEGLKYYAHIVSTNIFASLSANKLEEKLGDTIMKSFTSVEAGNAWLEKMKAEHPSPDKE